MIFAVFMVSLFYYSHALRVHVTDNKRITYHIDLPDDKNTIECLKSKLENYVKRSQRYFEITGSNGIALPNDHIIDTTEVLLKLQYSISELKIRVIYHENDDFDIIFHDDDWTTNVLIETIHEGTNVPPENHLLYTKTGSDFNIIDYDEYIDFDEESVIFVELPYIVEGYYYDVLEDQFNDFPFIYNFVGKIALQSKDSNDMIQKIKEIRNMPEDSNVCTYYESESDYIPFTLGVTDDKGINSKRLIYIIIPNEIECNEEFYAKVYIFLSINIS